VSFAVSQKPLVSFSDVPQMHTLTPLKSQKTTLFETGLIALSMGYIEAENGSFALDFKKLW
jgi:hypothetical protein